MQNFIMRAWRIRMVQLAVVLCALALAGCNAVRLGYNNGESLTYWWLNAYVDVQSEQKPWVKKRIDDLFGWHRRTQLRDYAQWMRAAQRQLQRPVTAQDLQGDYDDLKKRTMLVIERALPDLADLALALKPDQIAQLEKKYASNNERYRKDYLRGGVEDRQRFRFKKVMEQAEYWFGDFSDEQEALIRRASDARPLNNERWLAERQYRQREMLVVLRKIQSERPGRDAAMQTLRGYASLMIEQAGGGEHEQLFNAARDEMFGMAATVINCTTPAQKARAVKRLQQWIDDFDALAARAA
jgi:hypothetical protein